MDGPLPRSRRRTTLRLNPPDPRPDVPPPMAATSGPFSAPELFALRDAGPSHGLRIVVLGVALAGALGIGLLAWAQAPEDLAATTTRGSP